ncbi:pyrimidine/purine nucleoside phosphorylase [Alphaproteobacteria bacterium]|nr:pyrimidine/purine nucleoside phosphorylase [Alphaproteobacteria bacterium]
MTGKLNLRLKIDNDWKIIKEGMEFTIPKNSSFKVKVIELVNYTCSYFND